MELKRKQQAIALAGIFQACALVKQIAWQGKFQPNWFNSCIYSLLQINANSIIDLYGSLNNLNLGLITLKNFLDPKAPKDLEIIRYFFSLLHLAKILSKRHELMEIIKLGINRANYQTKLFALDHPNIIANFAGIYLDTLGTFNFRIQVKGKEESLTNIEIANKIRALLLAGIRATILWRQVGGSKLDLFLQKKPLRKCTEDLILQSTEKLYNNPKELII